MNIVDNEGEAVRQVVPADFRFLSDADQQVTAIMEKILEAAYGIVEGCPIAVSGVELNVLVRVVDRVATRILKYGSGTLLWNGVAWDMAGGEAVVPPGSGTRTPLESMVIVFTMDAVPPSPVYGATDTVQVSPHKRATAYIVGADEAGDNDLTAPLTDMRHIGRLQGASESTVTTVISGRSGATTTEQ